MLRGVSLPVVWVWPVFRAEPLPGTLSKHESKNFKIIRFQILVRGVGISGCFDLRLCRQAVGHNCSKCLHRRHAGVSVAAPGVGVAGFPCAAPARGHFQTPLASFRSPSAASFSFESDSIQKRWIFVRGDLEFNSGCSRSAPIAPFRSRSSECWFFNSRPFKISTPNVFDPGRSQTCFQLEPFKISTPNVFDPGRSQTCCFLCAYAAPSL